jgi:DNA-directed RNA polymerase subunit H (RpoH/RPB5)
MTQQSSEIQKIFKSRNILLDLLDKQGYDVSSYTGSGINEVNSMYQNKQMDMLLERKDKKVYIKYHLNKTLKLGIINDYIEDLIHLDNILEAKDDIIIIVKDEPNDSLVNVLNNLWLHEHVFVNVINIKRLQFNILNHTLVPKHRVLDEKETAEFKQKYNITDDLQIPDISRFSPVSQVIGIRPGQICEITRHSKTAINTLFYRRCQ